jgi:hypothetical protein
MAQRHRYRFKLMFLNQAESMFKLSKGYVTHKELPRSFATVNIIIISSTELIHYGQELWQTYHRTRAFWQLARQSQPGNTREQTDACYFKVSWPHSAIIAWKGTGETENTCWKVKRGTKSWVRPTPCFIPLVYTTMCGHEGGRHKACGRQHC